MKKSKKQIEKDLNDLYNPEEVLEKQNIVGLAGIKLHSNRNLQNPLQCKENAIFLTEIINTFRHEQAQRQSYVR